MAHLSEQTISLRNVESNVLKRFEEARVFTRHFGSFSKSDYEILMFTIFQDSLEKPLRDYDISIALGITESKVRSLRIKSQLLYPKKLEWTEELVKSIKHGYYDRIQQQVTVTFEDPSVQSLMKNMIEEKCGVVWQSLNVKQLILPVESFLLLAAFAEKDESAVLKSLQEAVRKESGQKAIIEKERIKDRFLHGVPDAAAFIASLLSIYSTGQPIIQALLTQITQ